MASGLVALTVPTAAEKQVSLDYLADQTEMFRDRLRTRLPVAFPEKLAHAVDLAEAAALADYCLALLNTNEFLYVP